MLTTSAEEQHADAGLLGRLRHGEEEEHVGHMKRARVLCFVFFRMWKDFYGGEVYFIPAEVSR